MIIILRSARTADDHQMITRTLTDYQHMALIADSSESSYGVIEDRCVIYNMEGEPIYRISLTVRN